MTERPHAFALETYEGILDYHSASIFWLNEIIACGEFDPDSGLISERLLLAEALNAHRVASKLVEAWHRDVTARADWEEAQRAAIAPQFRNTR